MKIGLLELLNFQRLLQDLNTIVNILKRTLTLFKESLQICNPKIQQLAIALLKRYLRTKPLETYLGEGTMWKSKMKRRVIET